MGVMRVLLTDRFFFSSKKTCCDLPMEEELLVANVIIHRRHTNKVTFFYILEYSINSLFCSADLSRNSLTWSEGMAKEIPGVTFMVFIPITSPSWSRPYKSILNVNMLGKT